MLDATCSVVLYASLRSVIWLNCVNLSVCSNNNEPYMYSMYIYASLGGVILPTCVNLSVYNRTYAVVLQYDS